MENEYKKIQDLLDSYEPEVPQQVWAGVEAGLRQKGGRKGGAWWYYGISIAASVVILMGLIWVLAAGDKQQQPTPLLQAERQTPVSEQPIRVAIPDEQAERVPTATPQRFASAKGESTVAPTLARIDSGKSVSNTLVPQPMPSTQPAENMIAQQPVQHTASQPDAPITQPQQSVSYPSKHVEVALAAVPQPSRKREIDFNRLSFSDVLSFVGNRLNAALDSPFTSFTETQNNHTVRTYELRLGKNVTIKRKQHSPVK